jgi:polysaccharide biosynthesis protein PslA
MNADRAISVRRFALSAAAVTILTGVLVVLSVIAISVASGIAYHYASYRQFGVISHFAAGGALVAFLYLLPFAGRGALRLEALLRPRKGLAHHVATWTAAFGALAVVALLTKTSASHSRGWLLAFYLAGLVAMPTIAALLRAATTSLLKSGFIAPRRVMIIGLREDIDRVVTPLVLSAVEIDIVAVRELDSAVGKMASARDRPALLAALQEAAARARRLGVDDVVLALPWRDGDLFDDAVEAFVTLPVAIHLDAGWLTRRFGDLSVHSIGGIAGLALNAQSLTPVQALLKRTFDIVVASVALVLLAPVFAAVALLIRLDTPGPVFFRQRRLGYNQTAFRIFKFRSMTSLDDGDAIVQAQRRDPRITRVGRWLRRTNIDELPQLINVLRGEMSIVGPRPHAVAHDRLFETRIERYPRRLNMRPGITGWAQVHGLRGETDTDDKMARRVEHDLYYIDNWSLGLDLWIIARTVFSRSSYCNAF